MALLDHPLPPSLGSQLWVTSLINYLSEFVNDTGEVSLTASPRYWLIVTNRQYVDVKMAIRSFGDRAVWRRKTVLEELLPLKAWGRDLGFVNIGWKGVFKVMYGGFTRNFKLLQFHYKLLMRITCDSKRKIVVESPSCRYCSSKPVTLQHIFLECPIAIMLSIYVEHLIIAKIDPDYNEIYFITWSHDSPPINFIWASFKLLYVSRPFRPFSFLRNRQWRDLKTTCVKFSMEKSWKWSVKETFDLDE